MKILFKVFPQKSHLNATFPLAHALRRLGHEVVYAGLAPLRGHVEAQGLAYWTEAVDFYPYFEDRRDQPRVTFWRLLRDWRRIRASAAAHRPRYARANAFDPLLQATAPDVVLVDSPYTFFALSLYRQRRPFALLESMMNLDRGPECPPLDTDYVPGPGWFGRCRTRLHWHRYFLKRGLLGRLGLRPDFDRRFVRRVTAAWGADAAAVSFDRYFHLGLRDVPELILSPRALDLPRTPAANQHYVGTSVDLDRQEVASDYGFARTFDRMAAQRPAGRPLVYASLGTAGWRYVGAERFLRRAVEAARGQPWNLLLALGDFSPALLGPLPPNVAAFQVVPQLRVLRHADAMISHGGMNSIAECVRLGVPLVVFPGTHEIDQAGNAARVVFHGVGCKGCLRTVPAGRIRRLVHAVLTDPSYRRRLAWVAERLAADAPDPEKISALLALIARGRPGVPPPPRSATVPTFRPCAARPAGTVQFTAARNSQPT